MAKRLVPDAQWERIEPLLPRSKRRRFRFPGRKPLDWRKVLTGILFILKTGIAWEDLPTDCIRGVREIRHEWEPSVANVQAGASCGLTRHRTDHQR